VQQTWRSALTRHLVYLLAGSLLLGLLSGEFGWALALGLAIYLGWSLRQLVRLHTWLNSESDQPPPESHGLWGDAFDSIYRLQRRNARARSQLQTAINRMQSSTAALRDAVILLDKAGNLEWWNPAAEKLLGLKSGKDAGQPICNLIRLPAFGEYFRRGNYRELFEMRSPVDERRHLQFQITLYGNQEHLLLVRDVTRVHQLEEMRKDFVANVSHELRTPLTVVAGYLETLIDHADQLSPRWQRALQQMQKQAARMQALLNDLLMLSRLESTTFACDNQPVALEPLLQSIRNDAQALCPQHRISLQIDSDRRLEGCENELRSAFSNLLFNAAKYTPEPGQITVCWWVDAQGGHFSVEDNGIGIEEHHLPRLTERFYRVDASRSSSSGGTGLGLAIVKHVLLRHDARLQILSTPGKGSTFICHFPPARLAPATR
jgi:two-component system phosphate regulon sensor histidine kinase PhoR